MDFNESQIQRYSRHIILPEIGPEGQEKILQGRVLIAGAGGLGSPAALYLAAAGVGTIGIIDDDSVDMTNLQRQIIHFTTDLKKAKVISAKEKISLLNPEVKVITYPERLDRNNIMGILEHYDFIIDGTDNFPTKFLVNDACVQAVKPFSHGGILRFAGQTMTYLPGNACYRCVFNDPPPSGSVPTCSQAGVLGSVAGMLGTIQATEALKFLTASGSLLTNRMLIFDAFTMNFRTVSFSRNQHCKICGSHSNQKELEQYEIPVCDLRKH